MNLEPCKTSSVESAYIITLSGHELSESLSKRCQESCENVGMPYKLWDAFDGTSGDHIKIPEHSADKDWLNWIKLKDQELSITEVSVALSHISLWAHCATINRPIVILEHDAIFEKPYLTHEYYSAIAYLGTGLQKFEADKWEVKPNTIYGTKGPNYKFIYKAHAYAIDPHTAKNLMAYVIKYGIHESLDIMLRADIFSIIQPGFYAYDLPHEETTITHRKKKSDGSER